MEIVPLTPAAWPALDALFQQGGDPRTCYCMFWRTGGPMWGDGTPADNRARLEALAALDPAPGLVALEDGVAVGWVGLGPRVAFERLTRSRTIPRLPGEDVWSVNCFVVARSARGRGLTQQLLEAAVHYAAQHGARVVEGYPVDAGEARTAAAAAYTGTRPVVERAGFEIASPTTSRSAGLPRVIARREP